MERQVHGFEYEAYCASAYGIELSKDYTSKWDGMYKGYPISIKCIAAGAEICMGDILRQSSIDTNFYLLVGFHSGDKIVEEHLLYIPYENYSTLFDNNLISNYRQLLSSITNERTDDEKWKKAIGVYRVQWKTSTGNFIRPRPKRDHKTQKRIQCAISNSDFYSYFIPRFEVGEKMNGRRN